MGRSCGSRVPFTANRVRRDGNDQFNMPRPYEGGIMATSARHFVNWQSALQRARGALIRRGRTEHDADDLVQEAWVRLACYERDHPVAEPEAFLIRAAINLSIDS